MRPNSAAILLRPAGVLYGLVMTLRNRLYDRGILKSWRSPIPVVSVGNITTGGTGKTPLVDWIVRFYHASGAATAIISRGYGRRTKGVRLVSDGRRLLLGSRDAGDETVMLAARNPQSIVIVAEKRTEGVRFLMKTFADRLPDVIVLDDAFQHRRIKRDLDIVVINASEPRELDAMLPEGRLREPLQGLQRAGLIILSKITDQTGAETLLEKLRRTGKPVLRSKIIPGKLVAVTEPTSSALAGNENSSLNALAFAGIGAPAGFLYSLKEAGIPVGDQLFFRDHEPYTEAAIQKIVITAEQKGQTPVTTEKDWFRISDEPRLAGMLARAGCRYLSIEPEFPDGTMELEKRLLSLLKR
ncbi:MAG: tetraacyldisaccharide 4'-kinase [Chlorobiaceae bacterium]|nr:tetraacyldisaccharide 4'-kinase [Chlorobiaceae bacterium]